MKILLTAINAKFIHSSLAIRSLSKYASINGIKTEMIEFTINHTEDAVLTELYLQKPDVLCFSCYIWNSKLIFSLIKNIKKLLPNLVIILGGPEVSYDANEVLLNNVSVNIVIRGEGELTFYELVCFLLGKSQKNLKDIEGITYRENGEIFQTKDRVPVELDSIPFVYDSMDGLENKIIYYETQRGCPYQCQYCLSSIEKGVRFLSEERMASDLQFFLDQGVKQVKFVDRTFNCNKKHALFVWNFIMKNDNFKTNFHMEITADLMDESTLELLKMARKGLFQFEIGVQSTNVKTIEAVKRDTCFNRLSEVVKSIKKGSNIHQHLDLIAGLPYESYDSFQNSFNEVYALEPEQFQLGFLKLLKGSGLRRDASKYGIEYRENAPYEFLSTNELHFSEVIKLKLVEEMVESYYNSGKALNTLKFLIQFFDTPFAFYEALANYWKSMGYDKVQHSKMELFGILYDFSFSTPKLKTRIQFIKSLLRMDIYVGDAVKTLPPFLIDNESIDENTKKKIRAFYESNENRSKYFQEFSTYQPRQLYRMCHIEIFEWNPMELIKNPNQLPEFQETALLFVYKPGDGTVIHKITL